MSVVPHQPITLHRHALSGHSHRVQLFLSLAQIPHTLIDVDLMAGAHKQPEFLRLNPFGQVPVIEDGNVVLHDSNAILVYLAQRYADERWLPRDAEGAARVQVWLSVAAGQIAFGPAAARLITVFGAGFRAEEVIGRAHALLHVMEGQLAARPFLVSTQPTIADVAAYSYIAHAPEGNVDLAGYPSVRAWLARIESLPGFVPMQRTAVVLAA